MADDLSESKVRTWTALVAGSSRASRRPCGSRRSHDAGTCRLQGAVRRHRQAEPSQTTANHDDVVALRGYVAAKEGQLLIAAPAALPVVLDAGAPPRAAAPPRKVIRLSDIQVLGQVGAVVGAPAAAPPEPHAPPAPVHAADFDSVVKGM